MVSKIFAPLLPGGVVVFNSVSEESCSTFRTAVEECGRSVVESHVISLDTHNPITILKAK